MRHITQRGVEEVSCNLCNSSERETIVPKCRDRLHGFPGEYDILLCKSCHVVYLSPRPSAESIPELYPPKYGAYQTQVSVDRWQGRILHRVKRIIKYVVILPYRLRFGDEKPTFLPFGSRKLLDIGCGTGEYLVEMKRLGWQVYGCDPNKFAIDRAKQNVNSSNLYHGTLHETCFDDNFFDAITLWHTLEHIPDPLVTLQEANRLMKSSGKLWVGVPNIDSWEARMFKERWRGLDVPRHLFCFSITSLNMMLRSAGFRVLEVRPQLKPSTITESVDFIINDLVGVPSHPQRKWVYYSCFAPAVLSNILGNWGCIEVTAVKNLSD